MDDFSKKQFFNLDYFPTLNEVRELLYVRNEIYQGLTFGAETVPSDIIGFYPGVGARNETKLSGLPFRRTGLPWPRFRDHPYTFVGQISFANSIDIIPESLGRILLVFIYFDWKPDFLAYRFHLEWSSPELGPAELIQESEVPSGGIIFDEYCSLQFRSYALLSEKSYSESVDEWAKRQSNTVNGYRYLAAAKCSQICRRPATWGSIDDLGELASRVICTIASISPDENECPFDMCGLGLVVVCLDESDRLSAFVSNEWEEHFPGVFDRYDEYYSDTNT
jgi:hypothetical protein